MLVWQEHPSTASAKRPLTGNVTGGSCGHAIRRSDVSFCYVTAWRSPIGPSLTTRHDRICRCAGGPPVRLAKSESVTRILGISGVRGRFDV